MAETATIVEPDMLTVREVASALRISLAGAYNLINAGDVPGVVRVRGTIRVTRDGLQQFIQRGGTAA